MHPLEGGADLARDPLGAGLADAAVGRHVGGEVAHGGVLGGEHVVPVRLKAKGGQTSRLCHYDRFGDCHRK